MLFNQKLAMAVKVNGKILREFVDTVYIPYGSEYSLLLKNLDTKRVQLKVTIDGQTMADKLVIGAGKELNLERSIVNNNLSAGNKFKFIERTEGIESHRGIKLEDGLVQIEYQFEQISNYSPHTDSNWIDHWPYSNPTWISKSTSAPYASTVRSYGIAQNSVSYSNDVGITVPGGVSNQKFSTVLAFPLEPTKHSMVIKLLGQSASNDLVTQAVTVKAKPRCVTCNHQNKATAKFCSQCGTALEIFA